MHLPSNFRDLTAREQLFVLLDLERVNRGEPPVLALTGSLDTSADAGAATGRDPAVPAGPGFDAWYAIDVDYGKPLAADWWWMYDDGFGSGNIDCHKAGGPGCWVHRDNMLAVQHKLAEPRRWGRARARQLRLRPCLRTPPDWHSVPLVL